MASAVMSCVTVLVLVCEAATVPSAPPVTVKTLAATAVTIRISLSMRMRNWPAGEKVVALVTVSVPGLARRAPFSVEVGLLASFLVAASFSVPSFGDYDLRRQRRHFRAAGFHVFHAGL